jgi:hypothetical protein
MAKCKDHKQLELEFRASERPDNVTIITAGSVFRHKNTLPESRLVALALAKKEKADRVLRSVGLLR